MSEVATFFTHFDQAETNNLDLSNFWGAGSPYVDFQGFQVLKECIACLEAVSFLVFL